MAGKFLSTKYLTMHDRRLDNRGLDKSERRDAEKDGQRGKQAKLSACRKPTLRNEV